MQETLAAVLTLVGFTAYRATNVEEALKILRQEHVDAVSLDLRMRDPSGQEQNALTLLKYLRSTPGYANVPVLLFTGADLTPEEVILIESLRAKVFYKPQPYGAIINELNRFFATPAKPLN